MGVKAREADRTKSKGQQINNRGGGKRSSIRLSSK
jgi:hypothetical protein